MGEVEVDEPKWMKDLEAKRERRLKTKLGHESGAGAPCLNCGDKCPGLDLHFWRKVCKNCKCGKESHDVQDDDQFGYAQFQLLGSKPVKSSKILLPGKKDELELDWMPRGQKDAVENFLKTMPADKLPVKGSSAANLRKELLLKQIPLHDIDPSFCCHDLTEPELRQMNDYIKDVKENVVGQGEIVKLDGAFDKVARNLQNLALNKKNFVENNPELLGRKVLKPVVDVQNPTLPFMITKYSHAEQAVGSQKSGQGKSQQLPTFNRSGELVNNQNQPIFDRVGKPITDQFGVLHFNRDGQLVNQDGVVIYDHNHRPITEETVFQSKEPPKVVNPVFELISRNYIPEITEIGSSKALFSQPLFNNYGELVNHLREVPLDTQNQPITEQFGVLRFDKSGRLVGGDSQPVLDVTRRELLRDRLYPNRNSSEVVPHGREQFSTKFYDAKARPILGKLLPDLTYKYEPVYDRYGKPILTATGKPLEKIYQPLYDITGRPILDGSQQQSYKINIPVLNKDLNPMVNELGELVYQELVPMLDGNQCLISHNGPPVYIDSMPVAIVPRNNQPGVVIYRTKEPALDRNSALVTDQNGQVVYKNIVPVVDDDHRPVLDSAGQAMYQYSEPVLDDNNKPIYDQNNQVLMRDFLPVPGENGDQTKYEDGTLVYQQNEPILDANNQVLLGKQGEVLYKEYVPVVDQDGRIVLDKFQLPLYEIAEPLVDINGYPIYGQYPTPVLKESKPVLNQFSTPLLDKYGAPIYEEQHIILDDQGKFTIDSFGDPIQAKTRVSKPYRMIRPNSNKPLTGLYNQQGRLLNDLSKNMYEPVYDKYGKPILDNNRRVVNKTKQPLLDPYGNPILDREGNVLYKESVPVTDNKGLVYDRNHQPVSKETIPMINSNNKPLYCDENNSVLVKERLPIFSKTGEPIIDANGKVVCQQKEPFIGINNKPILDKNGELLVTTSIPILNDDDAVLTHDNGGIIYQFSEPFIGQNGEVYYDKNGQVLQRDYVPIFDVDDKPLLEDNGFPVYQQNEPLINRSNQPVLDKEGNAVYKQYIPVVNEVGKVVVDSFGLPLYQVIEPVVDSYGFPILDRQSEPICKESTPVIDKNSCPILDQNGLPIYNERVPVLEQIGNSISVKTDHNGEPLCAENRTSKSPESIRPGNHVLASDSGSSTPEFYQQSGDKYPKFDGVQPDFIYEPFRDSKGEIILDGLGKVVNIIRQPLVDYFGNHITDNKGDKLYKDCIPVLKDDRLVLNAQGSPVYKEIIPMLDKSGQPMYDELNRLLRRELNPVFGKSNQVVLDDAGNAVYQITEPILDAQSKAVLGKNNKPACKYSIPVLDADDKAIFDKHEDPVYQYSEPYLTADSKLVYDPNGALVYREYLPLVDEKGVVVFDDNGRAIYQQNEPLLDANNLPITDLQKNILYKEYLPLLDDKSRVIVDSSGLPIHQINEPVLDSLQNVAYKESVPLVDQNGHPIVDENGCQVYNQKSPVIANTGAFARDNNGYPVFAQNRVAKGLETLYPSNYFVDEDPQVGVNVNIGQITDLSYPNLLSDSSITDPLLPNIVGANKSDLQQGICKRCNQIFEPDSYVVKAERSNNCYHADCFTCKGCNQSLADLMYFYHPDDDEIYCGRDYAKIRGIPRCHGCDELIFTKEYCLTHHNTYHIQHYCCYNCDTPLVGQKYVMDAEQPYCFDCFETVKADKCESCRRVIRADERGLTLNGCHYHVTDECFACVVCRKPLLGGKFKSEERKVYCSIACYDRR